MRENLSTSSGISASHPKRIIRLGLLVDIVVSSLVSCLEVYAMTLVAESLFAGSPSLLTANDLVFIARSYHRNPHSVLSQYKTLIGVLPQIGCHTIL